MPGAYLFGWDKEAKEWVKLLCTDEGKLIIDPSEIFENDPTDNEHGKGPDSDWAHDHEVDRDAHHDHTIAYKAPDAFDYDLGISIFKTKDELGWPSYYSTIITHFFDIYRCVQWCFKSTVSTCFLRIYHTDTGWSDWRKVMTLPADGVQYWSCLGIHFDAAHPDVDNIVKDDFGYIEASADGIEFRAAVNLPQGALVTRVIVFGNDAVDIELWILRRIKLSDLTMATMASQNINTEDIIIENAVIDNNTYGYVIVTSSLDTGDRIYGARITYTL